MDALACFSHFTHRSAHNEIKHAARVLSRYRDARRTRILRIRLRLTVRVKKARILRDTGESASLSITSHAALIPLLPK